MTETLSIEERTEQIVGKFVVATKSRKNKQCLFYIDNKLRGTISSNWWSIYLTNAKGFTLFEDAMDLARSLKYNNPIIYEVINESFPRLGFAPVYDLALKKCHLGGSHDN